MKLTRLSSIFGILAFIFTFSGCGRAPVSPELIASQTPFTTLTLYPTHTPYLTQTPFPTFTVIPSTTPYPTNTAYATSTPFFTHTPFPTQTAYPTFTQYPTYTLVPPTNTFTPLPPTNTSTPVPPTPTFTATITNTPIPPTNTFTPETPSATPSLWDDCLREMPDPYKNIDAGWKVKLCDSFNKNTFDWDASPSEDQYGIFNRVIEDGKMIWEAESKSEDGLSSWQYPAGSNTTDFIVSVQSLLISGNPKNACPGINFRNNGSDFYEFLVCNNGFYSVLLYTEQNGWEILISSSWNTAIMNNSYNWLTVSARGNKFQFFINGQLVDHLADSTLDRGNIGVIIDQSGKQSATYEFDNMLILVPDVY